MLGLEQAPLSRSRVDAFPRRISLLVSEHVHFCARRSPSAAELVRREVRSGVFEVTCALILSDIKEAFDSFQNVHPELHISREEFRMSLPWNVRAPAELHCWALATGSSYRAGQQPRVRTVPWCHVRRVLAATLGRYRLGRERPSNVPSRDPVTTLGAARPPVSVWRERIVVCVSKMACKP